MDALTFDDVPFERDAEAVPAEAVATEKVDYGDVSKPSGEAPASPAAPAAPPKAIDTGPLSFDDVPYEDGWTSDLAAGWGMLEQSVAGNKLAAAQSDIEQADKPFRPARGAGYVAPADLRKRWAQDRANEAALEIGASAKEQKLYPSAPSVEAFNNSKSFGEAFSAFVADPLTITRSTVLRSAPSSIPSVVAGVIGSAAGPYGAALMAGGASMMTEFGSAVADGLVEHGANLEDPASIQKVWEQHGRDISRKAQIRAGIIGAVDAATAGAGSKIAGLGGGTFVREAAKTVAGTTVQAVGGGAGEFGAQVATGEEIKPGAILGEVVGEVGSGSVETAGQIIVDKFKVKNTTERGPSEDEAAAINGTNAPQNVPPSPPSAAVDPAMAQAVAGQPVENPVDRARRVAAERMAAQQAAAAPPVVAPGKTDAPVTSEVTPPAPAPNASAAPPATAPPAAPAPVDEAPPETPPAAPVEEEAPAKPAAPAVETPAAPVATAETAETAETTETAAPDAAPTETTEATDDLFERGVEAVRKYHNTSPRFLAARLGIKEKQATELLFELEDKGVLQLNNKKRFVVVGDPVTSEVTPAAAPAAPVAEAPAPAAPAAPVAEAPAPAAPTTEAPAAPAAPKAGPIIQVAKRRVLKDLSVNSVRAQQEQAEQNEIQADRIKGVLKGPRNKKVFKEEAESTGKNWTKAQREARSNIDTEGQKIAEANPPAENESDFLDPNPGKQTVARAAIRARAEAIMKSADAAGLSIPDKVAGNTDETMNLGRGAMQLVVARDFLRGLKNVNKDDIADHYAAFVSRDLRLRNGLTDEVTSERRTEIDDKMRRAQGGNIETLADTRQTVESDAPDNAAESLDGRDETLSKIDQDKVEDGKTASDNDIVQGDERIVGKDDVETRVSSTAKKPINIFDDERASTPEPVRSVSADAKAEIEAKLRAAGILKRGKGKSGPVRALRDSEVLDTIPLTEAIDRRSKLPGEAFSQRIIMRVLNRIRGRIGGLKVKIVEQETLDAMFKDDGRKNVDGFYDANNSYIVLSANYLKGGKIDASLLTHEAVHAYLSDAINSDQQLQQDIQEILDYVRDNAPRENIQGLKDVHEFLSEALSNPKFQMFLTSVKVPKNLRAKYDAPTNLWQALTKAVAKHFSFRGRKEIDALQYALRLTELAENARDRLTGESNSDARFSEGRTAPVFYSAVQRVVETMKQGKASADQWFNTIKNAPGIKAEELEFLGLEDWLKAQGGSVTKQQLMDYIAANELQVEEVKKGEWKGNPETAEYEDVLRRRNKIMSAEGNDSLLSNEELEEIRQLNKRLNELKPTLTKNTAQYKSMVLPKGENYKELLITLPGIKGDFTHTHWGKERNVIAHIRFDERTGPNGEKILFINELQSDWHQQARKRGYRKEGDAPNRQEANIALTRELRNDGYLGFNGPAAAINALVRSRGDWDGQFEMSPATRRAAEQYMVALEADPRTEYANRVPDAPFKSSWHELALKRMVRFAAENGFDSVGWPYTPDQVATIEGWPGVDEEGGRYTLNGQDVTPIIERYTTDLPRSAGKMFKKFDAKAQVTNLDVGISTLQYEGRKHSRAELEAMSKEAPNEDRVEDGETVAYTFRRLLSFMNDFELTFPEAVIRVGSVKFADKLGGKIVRVAQPEPIVTLTITPSMRDSVMQGQPLFRDRDFAKELTDAGVPEDIASDLHDVLTTDLKDVDAETLAFVLDDLKTQYGTTSESNATTGEEIDKKVNAQANKLKKGAKELSKAAEDFVPANDPGRRKALWFKSNIQIAQDAADFFGQYTNPVRAVVNLIERRRVRKQELLEELTPAVEKLVAAAEAYRKGNQTLRRNKAVYTTSRSHRAIWEDFTSLMNDATMAEVHPDLALDDPVHKYLGDDAMSGKWAKKQHAELARRWDALPDDLKDLWRETRQHYAKVQDRMNLGRLTNVMEIAGHSNKALIDRFFNEKATEADKKLVGPRVLDLIEKAADLTRIKGPYFPLARRGDWRVQATYKVTKPKNGRELADNRFEFKTRDEAIAFAEAQELKPTIKSVYVDKTTGELYGKEDDGTEVKISKNDTDAEQRWHVTVQNLHVEFAQSESAARKIAEQLRADGLKVDDVQQRTNNVGKNPSADQISEQMKQLAATLSSRDAFRDLSDTQRAELKEILSEVSLKFLGSTRIQSRFIKRRNVEGASKDAVLNSYEYANAASGYLAKMDIQPQMDAAMKEMDRRQASLASKGTGAGTGSSELVREIKKRVLNTQYEEGTGAIDAGIRRLLQLGFLRYLFSPSYSFYNAMQPQLVALPNMAGQYGEARATVQLSKAYLDIGGLEAVGEGVVDTVKSLAANKGRSFVDEIKSRLKNAKERELLDELIKIGMIEADAGMMVEQNVLRPDTLFGKYYDPVVGYVDNIARQMPKAIEAINRSVVALATYRLAMAKHGNHANAIQDAMDMVDNSQGTYSNTNQAPMFSNKFGKIALQFKKYGQMMYYLFAKQIGHIIRNQTPGDRWRAMKSLAYTLAIHQVVAGTMGLPWEPARIILMIANGLGLTEWDWEEFEEWVKEKYEELTGSETAADMLTNGVTRGIGIDMSSRIGLDSLMTFGSPDSFKENDFKSFLFDTVGGASVSVGTSWVKGISNAMEGNFDKLLDALPFKFAVDAGKAIDKYRDGVYTAPEAIAKGAGFNLASDSREREKTGPERIRRERKKERYNDLFYGYINAGNDMGKVNKLKGQIREWNREQMKLPKKDRGQTIRIDHVEQRRREELRKTQKNRAVGE